VFRWWWSLLVCVCVWGVWVGGCGMVRWDRGGVEGQGHNRLRATNTHVVLCCMLYYLGHVVVLDGGDENTEHLHSMVGCGVSEGE
jgi:hypothetical protein